MGQAIARVWSVTPSQAISLEVHQMVKIRRGNLTVTIRAYIRGKRTRFTVKVKPHKRPTTK